MYLATKLSQADNPAAVREAWVRVIISCVSCIKLGVCFRFLLGGWFVCLVKLKKINRKTKPTTERFKKI